jgi:transposase
MGYDTDHVQNVGESPGVVTGIPTFVELLDNPKLAALYTAIRHDNTTGPELIDATSVSKKTVYDYLHKLEQAGLIAIVGEETGTTVYTAKEFTLTVAISETEVSITPELIEVIAQQTEYPVIGRVLTDHGISTFALAYDLVNAHNDGEVTIRQIAELTDLSSGTTYDLVEALYSVLSRGKPEPEPTTYTPAEFTDEDSLLADTGDE